MKTFMIFTYILIFSFTMNRSAAGEISEAAARARTVELQMLFGDSDGSPAACVSVDAAGDGYEYAVDLSRVLKPAAGVGVSVSPAVVRFLAKPQADGTWLYSQAGMPPVHFTTPAGYSAELRYDDYRATGVLDPAAGSFRLTASAARTLITGEDAFGREETQIEGEESTLTGRSIGLGLVDLAGTDRLGGAVKAILRDPFLPGPITMKDAKSTLRWDVSGVTAKALLDVWAYNAARRSTALPAQEQDELAAKILATLPVWNMLRVSDDIEAASLDTPWGSGRVAEISWQASLSGLVADAWADADLALHGIELTGRVPAWAAAFVPSDAALRVSIAAQDLEGAVRALAAMPHLSDAELLAAFLRRAGPRITFPSGYLSSKLYDISWDGSVTLAPATGTLSGSVKIIAKGVRPLITQFLEKAPEARMAIALALAAEATARRIGDTEIWDVDFDTSRAVMVNGHRFGY